MITTLLFDLGGVIMDIDRNNCVRAFEKLGMSDINHFLGEYAQKGIFAQLEEGNLTAEEFHNEVKKHCPAGTTDREIDDAFNDFLIGIPRKRLERLLELKKDFRLCLLSNTNRIMWDSKIAAEFRQIPDLDIHSYFDGIATSFEAHSLKPSPEIFRYTEEKLHLVPSETLFLDDSEANVDAARKLGFNAEVVDSAEGNVFEVIDRFLTTQE